MLSIIVMFFFQLQWGKVCSGQLPQDFEAKLEQTLRPLLEKRSESRVIVDIRIAGETPVLLKFGPEEAHSRLNSKSIFQIGSITKVFTGVSLAIAVERGECKLTDPANRFLSKKLQLPDRGKFPITFQELATHSSGLPRLPPDLSALTMARLIPADDPYSTLTEDSLHRGISLCRLPEKETASHAYSNLGMGLLGHALSHHAGLSYEALVRRDITGPLGMPDTAINLNDEQMTRFVSGRNASGKEVRSWKFSMLEGAGALSSCSEDLHRFLRAQQEDSDTELSRAMAIARESKFKLSETVDVGLGWFITKSGPQRRWWHNGATFGHSSFFTVNRDPGYAVVILCGEGFNPLTGKTLADQIAMEVLPIIRERATERSGSTNRSGDGN